MLVRQCHVAWQAHGPYKAKLIVVSWLYSIFSDISHRELVMKTKHVIILTTPGY